MLWWLFWLQIWPQFSQQVLAANFGGKFWRQILAANLGGKLGGKFCGFKCVSL
jgi:hypothetical protein